MSRRSIIMVIALLLAVSMAVACGTTPTQPPTNPAATNTPAPTSPAAESLCPWTGDPVTFTAVVPDLSIIDDPERPVFKAYKEAIGNIDIEWELVPWADFKTKLWLYLGSNTWPDFTWWVAPEMSKDFANAGIFLDLAQYSQYMPNWIAAREKNFGLKIYDTDKGENFFLHIIENDYPDEGWFANKTLLDQHSIPLPTNLAELESAMQKLKEVDPEVTPFHTFWGTSYYKRLFGESLNARYGMYFNLADKTWKHSLLSPESKHKELITLMADYYAKGYFNPEFSTMVDDQTKTLIASSKWGFTFTYGMMPNVWYDVDYAAEMPLEIVPLLPLAASGVKPNVGCAYVSDNPWWAYAANKNVQNPELLASWMDTQLGDEISVPFQWGIEGESYGIDQDGKKYWLPAFLEKGAQAFTDMGIWNIVGPRMIVKRDDRSSMTRASSLEKSLITMTVEAIKSGAIDSYYYRALPTFTEEENEELSAILTAINTKIDENEALFILGKRPMSEWDDFVNEMKALGDLERAVEIYNNAKQAPDRLQGIDREYTTP